MYNNKYTICITDYYKLIIHVKVMIIYNPYN